MRSSVARTGRQRAGVRCRAGGSRGELGDRAGREGSRGRPSRRLRHSTRTRGAQDKSNVNTVVVETDVVDADGRRVGRSRNATYFSQEHEFRIEFNHRGESEDGDFGALDDQGSSARVVAGKGALNEWITNPKLLLIASYGEANVTEASGQSAGGAGGERSVWCVTLPKVKVFSWTVIPSFDISATVKPNGVVFTSDRIVLDGINIPDSLRNTKIEFSLFSQLYLEEEGGEGRTSEGAASSMVAQNALTLGVYLPRGLSRLPGVKRTGNTIVRAILNSVDRTAKYKLMKSFQNYVKSNIKAYEQ